MNKMHQGLPKLPRPMLAMPSRASKIRVLFMSRFLKLFFGSFCCPSTATWKYEVCFYLIEDGLYLVGLCYFNRSLAFQCNADLETLQGQWQLYTLPTGIGPPTQAKNSIEQLFPSLVQFLCGCGVS